MANLSILIIEDEELFADKIEMLLDKMGCEHLATVDNSQDAVQLIEVSAPDLILMDIHIDGNLDGIELADLIHKTQHIPILFMTSLKDDMTFRRASRTHPIGFLTKPFGTLQLQRSIELVISQLDHSNHSSSEVEIFTNNYIFIKKRQHLEKVLFTDIIYLEADGRYTQVITEQKKYLLRRSLQDLLQQLSEQNFFQTHRSFAVNVDLVTSVNLEESLVSLSQFTVPVSKRNRDAFLKILEII